MPKGVHFYYQLTNRRERMEKQTDSHGQEWISNGGLFHPVDPVAVVANQIGFDMDAFEHARTCIDSVSGWCVDSLGHNIESNFPDIDPDDCDEIALFLLQHDRKG